MNDQLKLELSELELEVTLDEASTDDVYALLIELSEDGGAGAEGCA